MDTPTVALIVGSGVGGRAHAGLMRSIAGRPKAGRIIVMPNASVVPGAAWGITVLKIRGVGHLFRPAKGRYSMKTGQVVLRLNPRQGGSFTELALTGTFPTTPNARDVRRLLSKLAFWSGWPVSIVLSVDAETAAWCECWTNALTKTGSRDFEVRFEPANAQSDSGLQP